MRRGGESNIWIWGMHSVLACMECHPELILEIQAETSDPALERAASGSGLKIQRVKTLPRDMSEKRSQGVAARLRHFPLEDFHPDHEALSKGGAYCLLDGVEDPRNFGAILRSAAAFGIKAVFVPDRKQSPITGVVAQASAGNLFRIPLFEFTNANRVLEWLKEREGVLFGLDGEGEDLNKVLKNADFSRPVLWAVGSEGKGLRPGLLEKCDQSARIPMADGVESLNASVAASIAFFASHQFAK
jgi:23S rRNA (guanosine2251-2'-O)-methyltransferase